MDTRGSVMVLVVAGLLLGLSSTMGNTMAKEELEINLFHTVQIDSGGFVLVTEELEISNPSGSEVEFPEITLSYPAEYEDHIASIVLEGEGLGFRMEGTDGAGPLLLRISSPTGKTIPPEFTDAATLRFYLVKVATAEAQGSYSVPLALVPGSNLPITKVEARIEFPADLDLVQDLSDFTETTEGLVKVLESAFTGLDSPDPRVEELSLTSTAASEFGLAEFSHAERTIRVLSSGSISVEEAVVLKNYGLSGIKTLELLPANVDVESVSLLPASQPPLTQGKELSLFNSRISLEDVMGAELGPGGITTLRYEYTLPKSSFYASSSQFSVHFPAAPPVRGVVERYDIIVDSPNFVLVESSGLGGQVINASALTSQHVFLTFRPKLFWAAGEAIPIGIGALILAFGAVIVTSRKAGEGKSQLLEELDELSRIYGEKLGSLGGLVEDLRTTRVEKIQRRKVEDARRAYNDIRSRTAQRAAEIRTALLKSNPALKATFGRVAEVEARYDRAIADILNLYDQFSSGRMGREGFERLSKSYFGRYSSSEDALEETLGTLREDLGA